ncbi:MAG: agmatinase [Epsilonproteobacteria bacterium]|nr:MAG: agmatinase [Campylobacterota bacterium]RLA65987.1 MAG: agmatinase [Campylobacterota bacterium]
MHIFDLATPAKQLVNDSIHFVGFQFDGTACYRKGAKFGPDSIREASSNIETYSPYLDRDTADLKNIYDLGNLDLGLFLDVEKSWAHACDHFDSFFKERDLKKDNIKMITLGGEHSISFAPIKKYLETYPDLVLLHLDAHADLRDGYEGFHYSHASIIRRVLDHFGEDHKLIQYGIRSGTKEEFSWMEENKTRMGSHEELIENLLFFTDDRPIYLTLDLDYFDPSFLPGTGTPEAGGEDFHSFIKLIKVLKNKNFVGADITELSPEIDPTGNSNVFAAKIAREILLALV